MNIDDEFTMRTAKVSVTLIEKTQYKYLRAIYCAESRKETYTQLRNTWYGMGDAQCNSGRSGGEFSPIAFTLLTDR